MSHKIGWLEGIPLYGTTPTCLDKRKIPNARLELGNLIFLTPGYFHRNVCDQLAVRCDSVSCPLHHVEIHVGPDREMLPSGVLGNSVEWPTRPLISARTARITSERVKI